MFVQLLLEFYLFYFWFVNSDIQTWLSPSTKTNDHIMMDSHLPAPFACTTNSLLMCTSRYSWGWVWTLATSVTVQCKNTPRHTHTHPAELLAWQKVQSADGCWAAADSQTALAILWIINDAATVKHSEDIWGFGPQVDNFLLSTHTNTEGHIWGYTWKQLV